MEKIELSEEARTYLELHRSLTVGDWSASCWGKRFKINNHGIKLIAKEDEDLERIIFDVEKKTVSVSIKNPTLPEKAPRIVDLSEATEFFEELRKEIEKLLTIKGTFRSVTPNDDRTVFEIVTYVKSEIKDGMNIIPEGTKVVNNIAYKISNSIANIIIPNSVTEIGNGAFWHCTGLTNIVIPDSVTKIGDGAFDGCTGLTNIAIPNSVTEIGKAAFRGCTSLASVVIPDSVTKIDDAVFDGCTGLSSVVIPNSVTEIGMVAFRYCTSLINIIIPNSVTKIKCLAFYNCMSLTSIVIPDSVTEIGSDVFHGCIRLNSIKVSQENKKYDSRDNCNAIIETETNKLIVGCDTTVIPNTVTQIGNSAFWNCTNLTNIVIPESVTEIGIFAFSYCSGLTNIKVSEDNQKFDSRDNCNAIIETETNKLIAGCATSVIPNSVTKIEHYAFEGCTGLNSIVIPDSVTTIEEGAFKDCINLKTIVIPNSVSKIRSYSFDGCTNLTSIVIPDTITEIEGTAFRGCTGLTSIVIPKSVKKIGEDAFFGCNSLDSIYCYVEDPKQIKIERGTELCGHQATLYIPATKGVVAAYKRKTVWKKFAAIKPMEEKPKK